MLEYIPYFIANIFQSGAYAICMLYLTGELSQQKKHLWSTCISFFLMYWLTITIQLHDDDWIVIGLFLILCVYFLFVYFNTSKPISQCLNVVICGYLIETICQVFFIVLYNLLHIPSNINGYNDPVSLSVVVFGCLLLIPVLRFLPIRKWMNRLENISYSSYFISTRDNRFKTIIILKSDYFYIFA